MFFGKFSDKSVRVSRTSTRAMQTLEQPVVRKEVKTQTVPVHEKLVLVVNANTVLQEVEQTIRANSASRMALLVIYTSKPTLLAEGKREGEVDYEFAFRLDYGMNFLQKVSRLAEQLGVSSVETSYIWENTVAALIQKVKEMGDVTVNLARN